VKIVVPNRLKDIEDLVVNDVFTDNSENITAFPTWSDAIYYYQGDMIVYSGNLYRAIENNQDKQPDTYIDEFWHSYGAWDNTTGNVWNSATTYASGALVSYESGSKHYLYQSLTDSNTNKKPTQSSLDWYKIGAMNLYRCLDDMTNNKTERTDNFWVEVKSKKADTVALIGVRAYESEITVKDSVGDTVSINNTNLQYKGATTWSEYFFNDFNYRTELISPVDFTLSDYTVKVSLTNTNNVARLGRLVIGRSFHIGEALWGAGVGILDFSKKERDELFGDTYLAQGQYAKRADFEVSVASSRVDKVQQFLTSIRGQEALFIGDERNDGFDSTIVYGFVRDWDVVLENNTRSVLNIEIEGLI
jgi:hypothetical protein